MVGAAQVSGTRKVPQIEDRHTTRLGRFAVALAEFKQVVAAGQHYEDLRYARGGHRRVVPRDVPRLIFDRFYCSRARGARRSS